MITYALLPFVTILTLESVKWLLTRELLNDAYLFDFLVCVYLLCTCIDKEINDYVSIISFCRYPNSGICRMPTDIGDPERVSLFGFVISITLLSTYGGERKVDCASLIYFGVVTFGICRMLTDI